MKTITTLLVCAALSATLGGCAHDDAFQRVANLTGTQTLNMKGSVGAYVDAANDLRRGTALNVQTLEDLARARQGQIAATRQAWLATGDAQSKKALEIFDAVSAFGRSDALPLTAPPLFGEPAPTVTTLKFEPGQYDGLIKQLKELGEARSREDQVKFLFDFGKAVKASYEAGLAAATTAAASASTKGDAATTEQTKPAPPGV